MVATPAFLKRAGIDTKECDACHKFKKYREFTVNNSAWDGAATTCKSCRADYARAKYTTEIGVKQFLARPHIQMIANARVRARKYGVAFDLDNYKDEIAERVAKEVCELSGLPLLVDRGRSALSPSIDRIKGPEGYVYSNIRIIAFSLNMFLSHWGEGVAFKIAKQWVENSNDPRG